MDIFLWKLLGGIFMDKVTLSNSTFEALVKHLVEMEEGKNKIVDQYFPDPSPEREEFKELIEQYINLIESLVANARKSKKQDRAVPFVTIGCEVELEDLATGETLNYRIASPLHGTVREGDVSCLSPMGKSLLLRKMGDHIEVDAPGGVFKYCIKSIQLQNELEQ